MLASASLRAHERLQGTMISCSWTAGWRSLLLRSYDEPREGELKTAPTPDHTIVLITAGEAVLDICGGGRWQRAHYLPGFLGMTPPGAEDHMRWHGEQPFRGLHLHLPASILGAVASQLFSDRTSPLDLPNLRSHTDPAITSVMLTLERAAAQGAPDLYAETAAHFLASHLLTQYPHPPLRREHRLNRALSAVDGFMRAHLTEAISLAQLAGVAGLGTFQLLRAAKLGWGETPLRRLTRLRMEQAARLLRQDDLSIAEIAATCGYDHPAHFSTAFRRLTGMPPRTYREQVRR